MKAATTRKRAATKKNKVATARDLYESGNKNKRTRAGTPRGKEHRSLCAKRCSTAATCPWCWAWTDIFFLKWLKNIWKTCTRCYMVQYTRRNKPTSLYKERTTHFSENTHLHVTTETFLFFISRKGVCACVCVCAWPTLQRASHMLALVFYLQLYYEGVKTEWQANPQNENKVQLQGFFSMCTKLMFRTCVKCACMSKVMEGFRV